MLNKQPFNHLSIPRSPQENSGKRKKQKNSNSSTKQLSRNILHLYKRNKTSIALLVCFNSWKHFLLGNSQPKQSHILTLTEENFTVSLSCCVLSHRFNLFMVVKLAEVTLLLEKLIVVMPTVETMLMRHIVWWAYYTTSVGAPETGFMVWRTINCHLKDRYSMMYVVRIDSAILYKINTAFLKALTKFYIQWSDSIFQQSMFIMLLEILWNQKLDLHKFKTEHCF